MSTITHPIRAVPAGTDPFAALNEQQRAAVEHGIGVQGACPPLLVIAGAGSGKTMTLAARVARLVLSGADPQRLLLLTFSRRAAQEMERRVGRVLQQALGRGGEARAPALPWAGTFHSVGARLLRHYAARIGLAEDFTIHDRGDAEDLMGWVREELGYGRAKSRFPLKGTCLSIYSRVVNGQASLTDVLQLQFPWCQQWEDELKRLFGAYVQAKQQQHVLDYDDLLLYWAEMVSEPGLALEVGGRFDHLLVDEYQDTNRLQASILRAMKPDGQGLTVVGDDAQSIYSFRAAEVRNILDFPCQFSPQAEVVALERNYRSTQPILDASNAVMALARERHAKQLWTDRRSSEKPALVTVLDDAAQARWVADAVLQHREAGLKLKSQAVLFRSSHHSAALELELVRRNIPFVKFGGLKFLEAAHIKDVLSVLRWAENPRSRLAGFRVAQLVPGIGPATARRLLDELQAAEDPAAALLNFEAPPAAHDDWRAFSALYRELRQARLGWPDELQRVQQWYQPHLERLHDDAAVRAADLAQLVRIAEGYRSREQFLVELTLDPPEATSAEAGPPLLDEDYLVLSTIHSAKGQEWQAVYLLNAVDGCIPSDLATGSSEQIEEERRLLYVAMTRARQHLQLIVPQRFYVHQQGVADRHVYGSLTRFVPPQVAALFEARQPYAVQGGGERPAPAGVPIDLTARLRGRWS
ncbi:ATP-dependent helicase [Schlegelella sp. S2-27]|uniref:DNA 3'-5' helicase n=1 Tax=Caldimonas mangrovi TaxID=2944811 RepID=A0ABT0YQ34_9BURK|nr:ATP-dependent helicase [Caldimonas mangrovi]MCM5679968.1 ATP-dependent helicase [Caldimonas mangrovi]